MVRHNNQLPDNLPQLQNLIKRDPESYHDDFLQQYRHFLSSLEVFALNPCDENRSLAELVMFVAQVAQCYREECEDFPMRLSVMLRNQTTTLDPSMRNCFVKALILMRNKDLIPALDLLRLFYDLLSCPDKHLRIFLQNHIITDIKNMNAKHKDMKLNSALQNYMYKMLKGSNPRAGKMSIDIMIELYKKNIWNDEKTVNVIANEGCFSKVIKIMVASLKFFLGCDEDEKSDESGSDEENDLDLKSIVVQNRVNKKTKKRQKQFELLKRQAAKAKKKKKNVPAFNFSAIHLIHNPQGMAEGLFKQLQSATERFEVKLMHMDVISRLIGIHQLFLFPFYSYIGRYLQPHQRLVTRILQFAAQASHELVPNDVIEPILKIIANNFITERNSSDVMAIGLNATREICQRCPLAMGEDLLRDLALYKTYKEKSVMMAARSLIMLYREQLPAMLHKKDRGRLTEAQMERKPKAYGAIDVHETIPGAEVLLQNTKEIDLGDDEGEKSACDEDHNDSVGGESDGWEDASEDDDDDDDESDGGWVDVQHSDEENDKSEVKENNSTKTPEEGNVTILDKDEAAKELALTRIFTDEDFKKINAANLKKTITNARKRPLEKDRSEFVKLNDIEMIYKKRKHDKDSRLETVQKGREDRNKYGWKDGRKNINCSKTNREKRKQKNFIMMRQKARGKIKKSFREKQVALRNHLINQKKMK